jgi:hypothetical protein
MQRPVSVTVFGILNIVFAAWAICGTVFTGVILFAGGPGAQQNPMLKIMEDDPFLSVWTRVSIPLAVAAGGALLAAGIGLLLLKEWGRKLSIGYAIYAIVMGLFGLAINLIFVFPRLMNVAGAARGPDALGARIGAMAGLIGGIVGFVYPALLWYFMTRPHVRAAFGREADPYSSPPLSY